MASNSSQFTARMRSIQRLSDRDLSSELDQLNAQKHELDAELLLYLSELERRGLYREQSCSSLFEFCVTRLGCSEEVAYKRIGAARLLRQFPVILELLACGRIHLTGLMMLKPHLTEANHRDWLAAACGKSRRQIEKLIASRLPQPDARTSVRKLPEADPPSVATSDSSGTARRAATGLVQPSDACQTSPIDTSTNTSTTDTSTNTSTTPGFGELPLDKPVQSGKAQSGTMPSTSSVAPQSRAEQPGKAQASSQSAVVPPRIAPLSSHSYRVVFTASERLKQKLERACELLSHAIPPKDLPAVIERALDQLIEREENRRYALHPRTEASKRSGRVGSAAIAAAKQPVTETEPESLDCESSPCAAPEPESLDCESSPCAAPEPESLDCESSPCAAPERESLASDLHAPCQRHAPSQAKSQDPDPKPGIKPRRRSRYVPAAVRREVFMRDGGQCTFVDQTGRRCEQRRYLEFEHREAFAIGGEATVENLTIRCRAHNALEAEKLFGQERIAGAIAHAQRKRAR